MTVHWGFFADAIGHTGPSSALIVKQRLGGPTRALMLLVKSKWPTDNPQVEDPELDLSTWSLLVTEQGLVLVFQSFRQREDTFIAFVLMFLVSACWLFQGAGLSSAQPKVFWILGISPLCLSSGPEVGS